MVTARWKTFLPLSRLVAAADLLLDFWESIPPLNGQHPVHIEPSPAAFVVLFASMSVDWWRSHKLKRVAEKYDSQALEADALHFSTDVFSSGVVVIGLGLVWVGEHFKVAWLVKADPIAALVVSGVIVYVSWRLARKTIDALLDAAPPGDRSRVIDAALQVNGVVEVNVRACAVQAIDILLISRLVWRAM